MDFIYWFSVCMAIVALCLLLSGFVIGIFFN